MAKILKFDNYRQKLGKVTTRSFREKLKHSSWSDLDEGEKDLASAIFLGLGVVANRCMSADVIAGAAMNTRSIFE